MEAPIVPSSKFQIHFPVFRSCQTICPGLRINWTFRKKLIFYGGGVVKTYPKAATCQLLRLLIQYICSYAPYLEAISSIHNLTDTQCHGGNGPTWSSSQYSDVVGENRVNKSSWICLSLTHQGVLVAIRSAEKALRTMPILPSLLLQ
jgi:hypothetical protein